MKRLTRAQTRLTAEVCLYVLAVMCLLTIATALLS